MIDTAVWMPEAVALLQKEFGPRLVFVGLQGSYLRGEAREDSDIDILTVLDKLDAADLAAYRRVLRGLPEGEKAHGFTCGREELLAWPPFELFQFSKDTKAWYGELEPLLPPITGADTLTGARAAVSGLYHYAAHLYVAGDEASRRDDLAPAYKSFFFAMQIVDYLRSGLYARSRKELLSRLAGDEAELLRAGGPARPDEPEKDPEAMFQLLLAWAGRVMKELAALSRRPADF